MSFLRTSFRMPRLPRLPVFRARESIGGASVGTQVSAQSVAQTLRDSLDLDDLLKRPPDVSAEETPAAAVPRGPEPSRTRRRGPATLLERRDRLDDAVLRLAKPGAHIEFQANTIAVINQGNIFMRILRFLLWLPIVPIRWFLHLVEWVFRPRGAGRLKRTVVFVDRRGNVVVYRM